MKVNLIKFLLVSASALLAACAIITVNVYFPEKAVKEAYKSLDDMLLKGAPEKPAAVDKLPEPEQKPAEAKPLSRLLERLPSLSLVPEARAAAASGDDLAIELASMPDVLAAYEQMSQRLPRLNALFDSGAVGLTLQGLVTVRERTKIAAQDEALVKSENDNRKTVVNGMAKAILIINKQKETKEALDQVRGKAAATYADTKREAARPGWWMQLQNGRWVQK